MYVYLRRFPRAILEEIAKKIKHFPRSDHAVPIIASTFKVEIYEKSGFEAPFREICDYVGNIFLFAKENICVYEKVFFYHPISVYQR